MIEVRLRSIDSAKAVHLATVPFDQLDTVIPTLAAWGVSVDGDDYTTLVGQFAVSDSAAYFEVVAGDD